MTRVIQIDGAPGVGKTTRLMAELEKAVDDGLTAPGFWYLTFTRSGKEDAKEALPGVPPSENEQIEARDRVRTLHSLALRLAVKAEIVWFGEPGDDIQPILTPNQNREDGDPYAEFCERQGMRYDPEAADPRKLLSGEEETDKVGNRLFALNDFLTQTVKPPSRHIDAPVEMPIPDNRIEALIREWDQYKRTSRDYRLFEHGDYVREVVDRGLTPSGELLLIDEFQDFAPLEYQAFKLWRDRAGFERIYIAGDPNQSIYSFRGGTPHYFQNTDVYDRITLKESHRCPVEIAKFGNAVLSAHPDTDPRGFRGREAGGQVRRRTIHTSNELRNAVVETADRHADTDRALMVLTRTRYQLGKLLNSFRKVGVPFTVLGTYGGVWDKRLARIFGALNNWRTGGEEFSHGNVMEVARDLPDAQARVDRLPDHGQPLTREAVESVFEGYKTASELLDDLAIRGWKKDIVKNALEAPAYLKPSEVRAGTIHAAKGLEAPAVFLFTTTTETMVKRYKRDERLAAEEHRAYYVGATRASRELHLIDGYFDGPTAPPVDRARQTRRVVA